MGVPRSISRIRDTSSITAKRPSTSQLRQASYAQLVSANVGLSWPFQFTSQLSTSSIRIKEKSAVAHVSDVATHGKLTHLNTSGEAHMVQIPPPQPPSSSTNSDVQSESVATHKPVTTRTAKAVATVVFSNPEPYRLIRASLQPPPQTESAPNLATLPKGDVIATARIAGIMAAKRTADLIPLCHNVPLAGVSVDVDILPPNASKNAGGTDVSPTGEHGGVSVAATVTAHAQTGVEMEALSAVTVAGLTVYDMCKAVDRGMSMSNVRVVFKSGGRSGTWGDKGMQI